MTLQELERTLGSAAFDDLVLGTKCEATCDADRLADSLDQRTPSAGAESDSPQGTASEVVNALALLAMLPRIQRWHDEGTARYFAERPPTPDEVTVVLKRIRERGLSKADADACRMLAVRTLTCWMLNCSWSARRTMGVEVVLRQPTGLLAHVDALADFIMTHRELIGDQKGEFHGDT